MPCRFCYSSVCPQGHCLRLVEPDQVAVAAPGLAAGDGRLGHSVLALVLEGSTA